ncbi:phosphonate C-P lyase system protein PhnH [Methylicorpusculum sp.]|uniref:phosphonate C-P lyase system protein PhnH n=1 Tax=Methylicorpusculum sp. TaxID=2713644 RepID=UPI002ABC8F25|nr:phosphonate C-P lyase system protein PhnH [Methylicorpusculum sp.]MDZ4152974.1 phosphonate C-P lyase system protein PhnH [Methylicorpusculum sp.]
MIDVIWQAEFQQAAFRCVVEAFSRPGQISTLPECQHNAALALLATLVDGESSLADPHQMLENGDCLRLQIKLVSPELAAFILCQGAQTVDFEPCLGTLASPEQGATLVLVLDALNGGRRRYQLTGPGIETTVQIAPQGLDKSWFKQRQHWNSAFPLGVDMLLTSAEGILALPRTTLIKEID